MDLLRKLLIAILALSFTVFVALFGRIPAFRNTPIGLLHRLLCLHTPRAIHRADVRLSGGRVSKSCSRFGHYIMFERHPFVLIFFLALLTSASCTFIYKAWPLLPQVHHMIIPPLLATPYMATYACARSTSSTITRANHAAHLRAYPYDHTLYHPRVPCRTCAFSKPARSKHCSVCGVCVARADHHCAWVNNCIGRGNYASFLLLVASLGTLLTYGAYLSTTLLRPRVPAARTQSADTARARALRWAATAGADPIIGGIGLLAAATAPLAWGLLAYHAYLIYAGTTTNETSKWAALADAMAAGKAWRAARSGVLADAPPGQAAGPTSAPSTPWNQPSTASSMLSATPPSLHADAAQQRPTSGPQPWSAPPLTPLFERDEEDAIESSGSTASDASSDSGSSGSGSGSSSMSFSTAAAVADAAARWPLRSDQIVVRTRDGKTPVLPGQLVGAGPGGRAGRGASASAAWERVWRLEQVENLYDLGFWGNLAEVMWPRPLSEW